MRQIALPAILATALAAIALPPAARADDDKKEAERHFKLGVKLYGESKWSEALVEFKRAYELSPHPAVLFNLAQTHRELSNYDDSIQSFERFLAEAPGKVKPDLVDRAKRELEELRARVGSLAVTTRPGGLAVKVDGREVGTTPLERPLVLGPGDHTVEVSGEGYAPQSKKVTVTAGDAATCELELKPLPATSTGGGGTGVVGGGPALQMTVERRRWIAISASMATNTLEIADTGAPTLGAELRFAERVGVAADVVMVAWAIVPSVRVRLIGEAFQVHAVAALPVSLKDGESSDLFVAGAGGLGVRWFPSAAMAVRAELLACYAGSEHGLTLPASLGVELWF